MEHIEIFDAILPEELILDSGSCQCYGDGCNSDQGGCSGDAGCGQDC